MSVFVGDRFTAVSAVKIAREIPGITTLQVQCEVCTKWVTISLILWLSYLSSLSDPLLFSNPSGERFEFGHVSPFKLGRV
jgi:hypothetical protein